MKVGVLGWFARNAVAANVLMVAILGGGALMAPRVRREVFPEVSLDQVVVRILHPGASPEDVEQGVILATEEAIRGIDGVKQVTSTAGEGVGVVVAELYTGSDADRALADVKSAVDRITSFPAEAERPTVFLPTTRSRVVSLVVYGRGDEATLRRLAEEARSALLADPRVSYVELSATRPPEISIEVPAENLRRYGLTLPEIARRVAAASIDLPGGELETPGGEVLVRTLERRELGAELEELAVVADPEGTYLRLRDVARVRDTFEDLDREVSFDGLPAVLVDVYRVGDETPAAVSRAAHDYIERERPRLPADVGLAIWLDQSEIFTDRVALLVRNALLGLGLVILLLGVFLEPRLAFWVALGIVFAFVGAFLFLPLLDVSVNLISLFAFIVVLGLVVDDAIVVGEAIFRRRGEGVPRRDAALAGVRDVAVPVIYAVVTTVVAFSPMLLVPGFAGKLFRNIPLVVITVLALSLVESLLILPAHLGHGRDRPRRRAPARLQARVAAWIARTIGRAYAPTLRRALGWRYVTIALFVAILFVAGGLVAGGRVRFFFLPRIESDLVTATIELPVGVAFEETRAVERRLVRAADETLDELGGQQHRRGILALVGTTLVSTLGGPLAEDPKTGGHLAEVSVYLAPAGERPFSAAELARRWRARVGAIPGARSVRFAYETGQSGEAPIAFELSHPDPVTLDAAAHDLARRLDAYTGVEDVDVEASAGKAQLDASLTPEGRSLGITEADLARELRAAYFGAEALRLQRGRDEVRVYVRLPPEETDDPKDLRDLVLRAPGGQEVPLAIAAELRPGRAYTEIRRSQGRRVVPVTADVDPARTTPNAVVSQVVRADLPALIERFPGLTFALTGEQEEQREILGDLGRVFVLALLVIVAILAIAFRSYVQPALILTAIPFGIVGAVLGHIVLGIDLSLMSLFGIVALAGVVVNDSLILVVSVNQLRAEGRSLEEAVRDGAARRLRPVLLTSLTTFFGLAPMIFETSVQAQFLIPMAVSLGFGVMFATLITLILVPALYYVLEDVRRLGRRGVAALRGPAKTGAPDRSLR